MNSGQMQTLYRRAPYLISMYVSDFTKINREDILEEKSSQFHEKAMIPAPEREPVVGVIDTHFDENVYFHEWVEYKNMLPREIDLEKKDYYHGTCLIYTSDTADA